MIRIPFWAVLLSFALMLAALVLSFFEPITPDIYDCEARNKPANCWQEQ